MRLPERHDWLHMSLVELWHDRLIELAVPGSLELHLIDITIFIANSSGHESAVVREAFDDRDHLRSQLSQQ